MLQAKRMDASTMIPEFRDDGYVPEGLQRLLNSPISQWSSAAQSERNSHTVFGIRKFLIRTSVVIRKETIAPSLRHWKMGFVASVSEAKCEKKKPVVLAALY